MKHPRIGTRVRIISTGEEGRIFGKEKTGGGPVYFYFEGDPKILRVPESDIEAAPKPRRKA